MATTRLHQDIEGFFQRYATIFDLRRWESFIGLYHLPAMTVRANGSVVLLATREDVRAFFTGVANGWRDEGYARFAFSDLQVQPIGSECALATLCWDMQRGDGSSIREWEQSYQLMRGETGWQVLVSTFHRQHRSARPALGKAK